MNKGTPLTHDQVVNRLLRQRPGLAATYLDIAAGEAVDATGRVAFLRALRQVAKARGLARVAAGAKMKAASLSRAFSDKGNPTLSTLLDITGSLGVKIKMVEVNVAEGPPEAGKGRRGGARKRGKVRE